MGTIPEVNGQNKNGYNGAATPTTYLNRPYGLHPAFTDVPRVECGGTPAGMTAFLDHLSPASLVSPGTDCSRSSRESRSPSIALLRRSEGSSSLSDRSAMKDDAISETASDGTSPDGKDSESGRHNSSLGFYRENGSTDSEPQSRFRSRSRSRSGSRSNEGHSSDIGSSRESLKLKDKESSESNDSDKMDRKRSAVSDNRENSLDTDDSSHEDRLEISGNLLKTSTPYPLDDKDRRRESREMNGAPDDAMDLSNSGGSGPTIPRQNTGDLALSPPHSYTAQVRNVIRQRIMAGKPNGSAFDPVVRETDQNDVKVQNDANNNEPDATPKILKHLGLQPKRLETQISGEYSNARERPLSTPPEPLALALVPDQRDMRSLSRSTSLMSPVLGGENSMARNLALQMGMHPSPLAVMASHNFTFFHQASALMDGKSPYTLPVPPLLRPGSTPNSRGLSPVSMYPLPSPLPLPSPGSQRDSSGSPTDLKIDDDGREVGPNGEQRTYRCEYCSKNFLFKSKYHEHLPVHTNARPFRCHLCARTYKYKYDLRVHLRTHMGIPTKSTVCPFCNVKFETNKELRAHIKESHKDMQKASEMECTQPLDNLPPAL